MSSYNILYRQSGDLAYAWTKFDEIYKLFLNGISNDYRIKKMFEENIEVAEDMLLTWLTKAVTYFNDCLQDLENNLDISNLKNERIVKISALKDSGIESLKNEINDMFNLEEINLGDFTYLSNSRQISLVKKAVEISKNLEDALNNDVPIDLLEIDIKEICEILGEIIGESYDDKLIDTLCSNFCLGK